MHIRKSFIVMLVVVVVGSAAVLLIVKVHDRHSQVNTTPVISTARQTKLRVVAPTSLTPAQDGKPAEMTYKLHVGSKGIVDNPAVYMVQQGTYVTFELTAEEMTEESFTVDKYPDATGELDGGEITRSRFLATTPGEFKMHDADRNTTIGYLRVTAPTTAATQ